MNTIPLRPTEDGCARDMDGLRGSYVNGNVVAAVLDLGANWHANFPRYEAAVLRAQKGVWSDITRARRRGYVVREYPHKAWLADVVEIDRSKPVRSGGPMRAHYLKTLEERGGADPTATVTEPRCPRHWRQTWGVFGNRARTRCAYDAGNGMAVYETDLEPDHLVAYCSLVRSDDLAIYSMWMGHAAHLKDGVMHLLHAEVVEHLMTSEVAEGVNYLMYGGAEDGGDGLKKWKARLGFEPARLVAPMMAPTGGSR